MRKLSAVSKKFSRRRFLAGTAAAAVIAGTGARAAAARYRPGMSQPLNSPNYIRLKEMAENIRADTGGQMQIDVYPEGKLGSDNAMLAMLQKNELHQADSHR